MDNAFNMKIYEGSTVIVKRNWRCLNCFLRALLCVFVTNYCTPVSAFNVDIRFPIVFSGDIDSYFGYTVALHNNSEGPLALISAPKANSTLYKNEVLEPGVIYKCPIRSPNDCQEIIFDRQGNGGNIANIPYRSNYQYSDLKDNMWLGVSLDVQPTEEANVLACGHLWKNKIHKNVYLANGVCYIIDKELQTKTSKKLLPLIDLNEQTIISSRIYYYAFGQAGTSATFSMDGRNLVLGAPGFHDWKGTLVKYPTTKRPRDMGSPVIPISPSTDVSTYVGYSVTSGRFYYDGETYYAAGAPRAGNEKGKVFIFHDIRQVRGSKLSIKEATQGDQLGEYFGACVLGVNINNDKYTDLLVGAPLHSLLSGGDEGRVYLFVSNGLELQPSVTLMGSKIAGARFGSSIASLGDINKDGYEDVAIGAPYENEHGAIYIYHGAATALDETFAQRIGAEDLKLNVPMSGFGISISKAKDMDSNDYPDLLIGSYASDQAVFLRSHPVVIVNSSMSFNIRQIDMDIKNCTSMGKPITCFTVNYCLNYSGQSIPDALDFSLVLEIDAMRREENRQSRGYFWNNEQASQSLTDEMKVIPFEGPTCHSRVVHIYDRIDDYTIPVPFSLSYRLKVQANETKKFCATCPVVDNARKETKLIEEISFQTGCGDDDVCFCDLKATAEVENFGENKSLIVGEVTSFTVNVTISNEKGEPAYQPRIVIHIPAHVILVNPAGCDIYSDPEKIMKNQTLLCKAENPLRQGDQQSFQIKLRVPWLKSTVKKLEFEVQAKTDSILTNPANSYALLQIPVTFLADVAVTGISDVSELEFGGESPPDELAFTHTFVVSKYLASPVQEVGVVLYVPTRFRESRVEFLQFEIQTDDGNEVSVPGSCNTIESFVDTITNVHDLETKENDVESELEDAGSENGTTSNVAINSTKSRTKRERVEVYLSRILTHEPKGGRRTLNCLTTVCTTISCTSGPFINSRQTANFRIIATLNLRKILEETGDANNIAITTKAEITIKDEGFGPQPEGHRPDFAMATTTVVKIGARAKLIPVWVIAVGVIIGVLFLVSIIAGLIRLGFFRRKEKEELERMMQNAEVEEWDPEMTSDEESSKPLNGNTKPPH